MQIWNKILDFVLKRDPEVVTRTIVTNIYRLTAEGRKLDANGAFQIQIINYTTTTDIFVEFETGRVRLPAAAAQVQRTGVFTMPGTAQFIRRDDNFEIFAVTPGVVDIEVIYHKVIKNSNVK